MSSRSDEEPMTGECSPERSYLECPCCGDVARFADDDGLFHDGVELMCGCEGSVSVCSEDGAYVNTDCVCGDEDLLRVEWIRLRNENDSLETALAHAITDLAIAKGIEESFPGKSRGGRYLSALAVVEAEVETMRWRAFWLVIAVCAVVEHFKGELTKRNTRTWEILEEHLPQAQRADLERARDEARAALKDIEKIADPHAEWVAPEIGFQNIRHRAREALGLCTGKGCPVGCYPDEAKA